MRRAAKFPNLLGIYDKLPILSGVCNHSRRFESDCRLIRNLRLLISFSARDVAKDCPVRAAR
jgi:hypothetical protein